MNSKICRTASILICTALFACGVALGASGDQAVTAAGLRAQALYNQGYTAKAVEAFQKAVDLATRYYGAGHPHVLRARFNLARGYMANSQFTEAEPILRETFDGMLAAYNSHRGEATIDDVGTFAQGYGEYHYNLGQYAQAEAWAVKALKLYEEGGTAEDIYMAKFNLANIYRNLKDYEKAIPLYNEVVNLSLKEYGARDRRYGDSLGSLGLAFSDAKDYANAEKRFRAALEISGGERNGDPTWMSNLALTLVDLGRCEEAEALFKRFLALAEGPANVPSAAALTRGKLSTVLAYEGRWDEALALAEKSRRDLHPHLQRLGFGLSDAEQLSYLPPLIDCNDALSIAWARRADPGVPEKSASWLMNRKGFQYESMAAVSPERGYIILPLWGELQRPAALAKFSIREQYEHALATARLFRNLLRGPRRLCYKATDGFFKIDL